MDNESDVTPPMDEFNNAWIAGENGVVLMFKGDDPQKDCALPDFNTLVELLYFDGDVVPAHRMAWYHPACKWVWSTDRGSFLPPGHLSLVAWRPVDL